jgi:hypothetical protein
MAEKVQQTKWFLLISPNGDWAYTEPTEALTALEAIKAADEEADKELGNEWRVFALAGPGYEDFKTNIEVVPA